MGGTLSVSSIVDEGTEFMVDLQLPISTVQRAAPIRPRFAAGARVVLVCAQTQTREAIGEMLSRAGVAVDEFSDRQDAIARVAARGNYAFVLIDAPPLNAPPAALLDDLASPPPVVLLTSLHRPLNNSALGALGAAAQLRKPVREDHLAQLLDDVAAGRVKAVVAADHRSAVTTETPGPAAPIPAPRLSRPAAPVVDAAPDGRPRVLVVDDVELNLMVARAMLGSLGVQVMSANGGPAALDIMAREPFALVLMDCHMPEVDGYEVTRRVRGGTGPNAQAPIVALSASAFAEDRQRAIECGMNDFAPKPIELRGLRSVLEKWIPQFEAASAASAESPSATIVV
jgi:CheY-like chemotaxis protein